MLFTLATQNKPAAPNDQIAAVLRFQASDFQDRNALQFLIESNIRSVIKIAKGYVRRGCELEDLIAEGTIGLMEAAQRWEPEHGANFNTYASNWIRARVQEFVQKNSSAFKVGGRTVRTLFQSLARVLRKHGKDADVELIASELSLDVAQVTEALQFMNRNGRSLDAPMGPEGRPFYEVTADNSLNPEQALLAKEEEQGANDLFVSFGKSLSERDRVIYFERMLSDEPRGLQDLADQLGVSAERVRQLEKRIFNRLESKASIAMR